MQNIRFQDLLTGGFLLMVILASTADLLADLSHGVTGSHILQELVVLLAALAGISWLVFSHKRGRTQIESLRKELQSASDAVSRQSQEIRDAKRQLADVIQQQFQTWQLTTSEQEVGRLLLKGLSFKEMAALREVSEKTIRQQASSIYQKSGLAGRHEFAAWFLEDLF
ncbi:MAG: LuxR C-terminal-related transcriptional regulator [Ketobacteraceae bacterium]|nr:LuxR C-terminal-related transcriptional regulator [Ketobacteraceae bacterium]